MNQATLARNFFVVKREFANQYSRHVPECVSARRIIMKVALNIARVICARAVCARVIEVEGDVGGVIAGNFCSA